MGTDTPQIMLCCYNITNGEETKQHTSDIFQSRETISATGRKIPTVRKEGYKVIAEREVQKE
jgi:hypothetical protein